MAITLAQAAEATGRNRSTILRSIRRGTLSAVRDPRTQAWMVEPAELFRIFPPVPALGSAEAAQGSAQMHKDDATAELRVMAARLEAAEARIADKDTTIAEQRGALDNLRRRLDTATTQLGEALQQVRALTDQRAPPVPTSGQPAAAWRRWWRWR